MKYKHAKINCFSGLSPTQWWVSLGNGNYLTKNGEVLHWLRGQHNAANTDHLIMHPTQEQAQATLDKYNKSEPTLSEIKQKLSAAKELIGKKIKIVKGHLNGEIGVVISVDFILDGIELNGPLALKFMDENGYVILLRTQEFGCLYDDGVFEVISKISVTNHSGQEYFAEQYDKYWQFGCAKISKALIKDSLALLDTNYADGNRKVGKITIGAADFDMDTLKKLVDADNNK